MFGPGCAVGLLAGVATCLWLPGLPPFASAVLLALAGGLGWYLPWRVRWAGALLFGFAWTAMYAHLSLAQQLSPLREPAEWQVVGKVMSLPEHEARRTRFRFLIQSAESDTSLNGRSIVLSWYDDFGVSMPGPRLKLRAGETWRFHVRLRAPRSLRNPGGFDRERYALVQGIAATGYIRKPQSAQRMQNARGLAAWREAMSARIGQGIKARSSRFIRAMALGDTRGLTDEDWELLRATGLTHLIAISGFHVGMVSAAFAMLVGLIWRVHVALPKALPRPQAISLAAALAGVGYAAVAGFALPTVRTALMMIVWALARMGRRPAQVTDTLAMVLVAVLLFDPLSPLAAGFWLSFAGVAWLSWALPADSAMPLWRGFLSAQAVATLGLLPLTVVLFGQASLAGPWINLLAIPWWSLVVVPLSLLGLLAESLVSGAGLLPWRWAAFCFDLLWPLIVDLGRSDFALWWLPESPAWALPLALLGAAWLMMPRGTPGKALSLFLWWPLLWPDLRRPAPGDAQITVIDVGQGLSVIVRTAHHALLYDTGPATRDGFDAGERAVVPTLRALGIARLDRIVLSHGDNDHAGGYAGIVRTQRPTETWMPPRMPWQASRHACHSGVDWRWDGVRFRFLHPSAEFPYLGNESSCVLRIDARRGSVLLMGDIGEVIERDLVRRGVPLRADIVLAAHHGSAGSSDPAFVKATGARLVLVSSGHGNRFGHPRPEVVARWRNAGAEVLDTARSGALQVWLEPQGVAVRERRHAYRRFWDAEQRHRNAVEAAVTGRGPDSEPPRRSGGAGGDSL